MKTPDPLKRNCGTCLLEIQEIIPLDSEGTCSGCGSNYGKAQLVPNNPVEGDWSDWPEESFDKPPCKCYQLDNHSFCPVHGLDFSIEQYQVQHPELFHYEVQK